MRKTDKHRLARAKQEYELLDQAALVRATAGREKGQVFLKVGAADAHTALICDGRQRTLDRPKRKNEKHLEYLTAVAPADWQELVDRRKAGTADAAVRKLVKQWHKERIQDG